MSISDLNEEPVNVGEELMDGDGYDDEEEDDDEEKISRDLLELCEKIVEEAKSSRRSDQIPRDWKKFWEQFLEGRSTQVLTAKTTPQKRNLLHLLAESTRDLQYSYFKSLVKALVELEGNLLTEQDFNGQTPLFYAITLYNHELVRTMCDAHPDIDSILGIACGRGRNCLHQAIINKSNDEDDNLVMFLIDKSSKETIHAADNSGLTPLHLAVEYQRCDAAQVQIVRSIVEKCDEALDAMYENKDKVKLSPYRYHEYKCQEIKRAGEATDKAEVASRDNSSLPRQQQKQLNPRPLLDQADTPQAQPPHRMTGYAEAPTGKLQDRPKVTRSLRSESSTKPESTKKKTKKGKGSRSKYNEDSANKIKNFLKLQCLRNRSHDDAADLLYGPQQDRQIYFDLIGVRTLSESHIKGAWHHFDLENVLQYVFIPQVHIEPKPPAVAAPAAPGMHPLHNSVKKSDGVGRTDLVILFTWLKEIKNVETILKVIVEDLEEPSHSDETIETCLGGMGVEIWDWRKTDLCSELIYRVSPDTRELHLYWTGRNAVLRGWSEAEGLKKLKKLEEVHLHVLQGLDSSNKLEQYVTDFKERLQNPKDRPEGCPSIKVQEIKVRGTHAADVVRGVDAVRDPFQQHKWITTMEEFAEFLQNAETMAKTKPQLKHHIRVAVIDDGVDVNDPVVHQRIEGGRSFCHRDESRNLNEPYYVSRGGHGTAMARLICKVCPGVRLYILKLDEHVLQQGKRQITARSAYRAVQVAIDKHVDIISMSWTIDKNSSNDEDIRALEKAIQAAAQQGILMFCAASDQGVEPDRTYPAAGSPNVFKIGAAGASGDPARFVGSRFVNYLLPGEQVVVDDYVNNSNNQNNRNTKVLTGSSVATALASGLAAMILYCVQLGCVYRSKNQGKEVDLKPYMAIKDYERMRETFDRLCPTDSKYITVWKCFEKPVKNSKGYPPDECLEVVANIKEFCTDS